MQIQKLVLFILAGSQFISGCASVSLTDNSKNVRSIENGKCVEGTTRQGFISPTTSGDSPCYQGIQTCLAGHWQGPTIFTACENFTKSCDGQPYGSIVNGYLQPTTPHGTNCTPATKTCLNGIWSGPEVFPSCTEL
jgi:hypothetical protein